MKRLIFLILKKLKINKDKLLDFYIKNNIELEINSNSYISLSITDLVEFEKFIDSIVRYIKYQEPGFLYNISEVKAPIKIRVLDFFTLDGYYIENINEINLRLLRKIQSIYIDCQKLDEYHSRNIKSHIIILEDYLSIIL